jgi:hypothetical protein
MDSNIVGRQQLVAGHKRVTQLDNPRRPRADGVDVDLHRFMNGIAALPPADHILIHKTEKGIHFAFSEAPQKWSKVHEANVNIYIISHVAFHPFDKQALN